MPDSCIANVAYNPATLTLIIDFNHGGAYAYELVPPEIYAGVLAGGGSFFNESIRDVFPATPVAPGSSALLEILELTAEDVLAEGALVEGGAFLIP
jgi:hypothetical protein